MNKRKNYNKRPLAEGGSVEGTEKGAMGPAEGEDGVPVPGPMGEHKKWARRVGPGRRRSALQESFPSYMQVCETLLCYFELFYRQVQKSLHW